MSVMIWSTELIKGALQPNNSTYQDEAKQVRSTTVRCKFSSDKDRVKNTIFRSSSRLSVTATPALLGILTILPTSRLLRGRALLLARTRPPVPVPPVPRRPTPGALAPIA